jgi:predicted alpha/beta superfamily hydrolase
MQTWEAWPPDDGREHSVTGTVLRLGAMESPQLGNQRDIFVYLPPSRPRADARFPVLYMQDGQNLFDRAIAFGNVEWQVDETMEACSAEGMEAIVVGISNTGNTRIHEYSPFLDARLGGGAADRYLTFLLETVKPRIDADFPTRRDAAATMIAGSSMGGLLALYAFFRHPAEFGGVAALSPSLWFSRHAAFRFIAHSTRTDGRIYADMGTREGAGRILDVARLRRLLAHKGYRKGRNLVTVIEPGGRHSEAAWGRRFRRAVRFLLQPATTSTNH